MVTETRLVTAALPYVNNVPHLGNIAGSHLPAVIFARYSRIKGYKIIFIGGIDEYGTASETAAQLFNITPKQLCDFFYKIHKEIYDWFQFSYDNFSRTSREIHLKTTQEIFLQNKRNNYIQERTISIPFCLSCQRALADRYIQGTCPYCQYDKAKGDQCEHCNKLLDPEKLINAYCTACGKHNVQFKEKKHLFLQLDKLQPQLEKWIKKNKTWRPQVKSIAEAWLKEGLKARDITRDLKWGIPVPLKGFEDSLFYVWYDAPIGYISSTKEWAQKKNDPNEWKVFWENKKTKYYCFIGKDNIPFHTIFFPAILMADGRFILPYNVVGLQYLNYERAKFSKSQKHGVFCENLPKAGLDPDYWRFYLSLILPETKDSEFLWDDFKNKINAELIGNLSNFINRTLSFVHRFEKGITPKRIKKDLFFERKRKEKIKKIEQAYERVELREALLEILNLSSLGNKYFDEKEIWRTKDKAALSNCIHLCKDLGILLHPFIPQTSKKILELFSIKKALWKDLEKNLENKTIKKPELLFKKLEEEDVQELKRKTSQVEEYFKEAKTLKQKEFKEHSMPEGTIHYLHLEDFQKADIRIGEITEVKDHPKAERLFLLTISFGLKEKRQIIAGLKEHYTKEELMKKQVAVILNLEPVALRGITSYGMLLAAVDENNKVSLLTTDKKVKTNAKVQ